MRRLLIILLFGVFSAKAAFSQEQEAQQLLLNVAKLVQLKQILTDLKKGYEILSAGYGTIKNLSEGNFNLHKGFLDGLATVSPLIRNSQLVTEVIVQERQLLTESARALKQFRKSSAFTADEQKYLKKIHDNLISQSGELINVITSVITDGKLRMSDAERIKSIEKISLELKDRLLFLRDFNSKATVLALQRTKEQEDVKSMKLLYGVNR
jgi:hypothetical protein